MIVPKIIPTVAVVTSDDARRPRPPVEADTHAARTYAAVGPGLAVLQFTQDIDCMIALLIGLLGGMLAGMALSRARVPDEPEPPTQLSWTPPAATGSDIPLDSTDETFTDDPALTDEERIIGLLSSNGGRMKQSQIVEETDWSKAKVSRLLSSMAEHDEITKLTIGRENIIFLGTADEVSISGNGSKR